MNEQTLSNNVEIKCQGCKTILTYSIDDYNESLRIEDLREIKKKHLCQKCKDKPKEAYQA